MSMASVLLKKLPVYCKHNQIVFRIRNGNKKFKNFSTNIRKEQQLQSSEGRGVTVSIDSRGDLIINSGKLAKLADGCVSVSFNDTTVMATVVSREKTTDAASFVPLTVSYQQKAAALGRIPLNFLRREMGQTDHEILTSRMIDRSLRSLFPNGFNWDTQIICVPLAIDGSNFPDVLAINAASAALAVSDVPWNGPVGAVRMGLIDNVPVVNPTKLELKKSKLNLVMSVRDTGLVVMLDGSASNIEPSLLFSCFEKGVSECQKIVDAVSELRKQVGKEKRTFSKAPVNSEFESEIRSLSAEKLTEIFQNSTYDKLSRDSAVSEVQKEVFENVLERFSDESHGSASEIFKRVCKDVYKDLVFKTETRCDGRTLTELRNILCEVNMYEPLHGSALFQRGQTQVLCTVVLDSPQSALKIDKVQMLTSGIKEKNFFVHYEFPPFATKETGRLGPLSRREIGHGALAEKALQANIPPNYPFTIRLTSEVLESNGSSSMATVCGGTLALMDAGVPIQSPCAGVAMGFLSQTNDNNEITDYKILTDILGLEDYFGEMDFKIAGTESAFTAFQLDVKNSGIPPSIIQEILIQAKTAIQQILEKMKEVCPKVRSELKKNCPEVQSIKVAPHLRARFLGPGGMNIKKLETDIGVEISEEDANEFQIFAPNKVAMGEALEVITELLKTPEEYVLDFGGVYSAQITEIKDSGCMVKLYPEMTPVYIHVSQLDVRKVSHPSALGLKVGQEITVKYFGRDPVSGSMRLSRKVLMGPASEVVQTIRKRPSIQSEDSS